MKTLFNRFANWESALSLDFPSYALFAVMTWTTRTSCSEVQTNLNNS